MKIGDTVRVTKIPDGLDEEAQKIFSLCLGKCFPVSAIESDGRLVLLVGRVVGVRDYLHSIYLLPDEVEPG
jgi:hypothetical protein